MEDITFTIAYDASSGDGDYTTDASLANLVTFDNDELSKVFLMSALGVTGTAATLTVKVPAAASFPGVGVYVWKIMETPGNKAGVSYAVVEQAKHTREGVNDVTRGYAAAYANSDNAATGSGSGSGAIAAGDADTVAVTNTKNSTIETGVKLDSLPYIVLLAVAVVGMAVALMRRRKGD